MMYLIVGRTGSGKDYLANLLQEKGMKLLKSYTTRPKRNENEDAHIFIDKKDINKYPNKVATTIINGYHYFATKEQVEENDIYIIDPNGINELVKNMPDEAFHIIYVDTNPLQRKTQTVKRADNKLKEEAVFDARDKDEDEQFSDFEDNLDRLKENYGFLFPQNVTKIYRYQNKYDENAAKHEANVFFIEKQLHDRVTYILKDCVKQDLIPTTQQDTNKTYMYQNEEKTEVSLEQFADIIIDTPKIFTQILQSYMVQSKSMDEFFDNITT